MALFDGAFEHNHTSNNPPKNIFHSRRQDVYGDVIS